MSLLKKYNKYNIVIDGDSIDCGCGSSANFENIIEIGITNISEDHSFYKIKNVSVAGQDLGVGRTPNMVENSPIDTYYRDGYLNICLMGGGTNDICGLLLTGKTHLDLFNDFLNYYNARVSTGWIVIPRNILPRSQPLCNNITNFENDRNNYNTLVRNYCITNNIYFNDIGVNTIIGKLGDSDNTTYYQADNVHLKQAGADILGNGYVTELIKIL